MDIMSFVTQPQVMISLAVLIVLLWRISYGYKNGFVAELIGIAALACGFAILLISADALDGLLHDHNIRIVTVIIRIAVASIIYKAVIGIARGMKGVQKIPLIGTVDRLMGACFGALETYIGVKLLQYITDYDFESAVSYTLNLLQKTVHV